MRKTKRKASRNNISLKQWSSMTSTVIASLGALYLAIANIWNLPYGTQVSNTAFELAAFISAVLGAFTFHSVIGSVGSDILKDIGKEDK